MPPRLTTLVLLAGLSAFSLQVVGTPPASADTVRVIALPTAAAGLTRITSAGDGTVFFQEADGGRFGYLNADGTVSEHAVITPGSDRFTAMDVAPDGRVWVATRAPSLASMRRDGTQTANRDFESTVTRSIRVTADGTGWLAREGGGPVRAAVFTASGSGASTSATPVPGSENCTDVIGLGGDGKVWCATANGLESLSATAAGPERAVPGGGRSIRAIAAGPGGATWFARAQGGSLTTGGNGDIGYVDTAGTVHDFALGARVAPTDLAPAADGSVWFTSAGEATGIGHLRVDGTGSLTSLPGYNPQHLTVTADGTVVATDPVHNVLVAASPSALQTTNVDPGAGSVLRPSNAVPRLGKKPLRVRHSALKVKLDCPAAALAGCAGGAVLAPHGHAKSVTLATYSASAGQTTTIALKLTRKSLRKLRHRTGRFTLTLTAAVSGEVATTKLKVRS